MKWIAYFIGFFIVWLLLSAEEVVEHPAGILVEQLPTQVSISHGSSFFVNDYRVTPVAEFKVRARVLSRENYRFDPGSDLSPLDLALGWGPMSDSAVLAQIDISQSNRFYWWHVDSFPIPRRDIEIHSANMHLIPSSDFVRDQFSYVQEGSIVEITGKLVNAQSEEGWRIKTSTTREDTGAGGCEVIWVEQLVIM